MADPLTLDDGSPRGTTYSTRLARGYFGGYAPIIGSWDEIDGDMGLPLRTENAGFSAVVDWNLGPVTLTSVSAVREFSFDANNDQEQTRFPIRRTGTLVDTRQVSQELRFTGSPSTKLDYQAGVYVLDLQTDTTSRNYNGAAAGAFFATNAQYAALDTPSGRPLLDASLNDVLVTTFQNPATDSVAVFGQTNWHFTDRATLTLGLRRTDENKTSDIEKRATYGDGSPLVATGNATADAIRAGQLGNVFGLRAGDPLDESSYSWLVNPSYSVTDDVLRVRVGRSGREVGLRAVQPGGRVAAERRPRAVAELRDRRQELAVRPQTDAQCQSLSNARRGLPSDHEPAGCDVADGIQLGARQHSGDPRARRRARWGIRRKPEPAASPSAVRTTTRSTPTGRRLRARAPWRRP